MALFSEVGAVECCQPIVKHDAVWSSTWYSDGLLLWGLRRGGEHNGEGTLQELGASPRGAVSDKLENMSETQDARAECLQTKSLAWSEGLWREVRLMWEVGARLLAWRLC